MRRRSQPDPLAPVSAEYRLLLEAARPIPSAEVAPWLEALDWTQVVELAAHHRLVPLLARYLRDAPGVPDDVRELLRSESARTAAFNLTGRVELREVAALLSAAGIPALALKGAAMLEQVYEPGLRLVGDLDLLVGPEPLERAAAALVAAGYGVAPSHPYAPDEGHWHYAPLVRADRRLLVELHRALPLHFDRLGVEMLERGSRSAHGDHLLPDHTDLLLMVALHFTSNRMRASESSLRQLTDLAWTIERCEIDWDELVGRAAGNGVAGHVFVALESLRLVGLAAVAPEALEALRPATYRAELVLGLLRDRVLVSRPWECLTWFPGVAAGNARPLLLPGRAQMAAKYDMPRASLAQLYLERARRMARVYRAAPAPRWRALTEVLLSMRLARSLER